MKNKYDVFISCKSEDYPLGRQIYEFLTNKGITVFLADKDLRKLGISDYGRVIDDAIEGAMHMLVVLSSVEYVMPDTSPYVYYEWHTFSEEIKSGRKQGNLMTVLTEPSIMPRLPIAIRNNQSFLFSHFTDVLPYISVGIKPADRQSQSVNIVVSSKTKETSCEQKDRDSLDASDYEAVDAELPNLFDLMIENPNVQTAQNSTDVFFFGMPGAGGKTCLLMSLGGNNGKGFFMKTTGNAGKYVAGLSQYYKEGQLPGRTFGRYWAAIETVIQTENSNHKVNFVEMPGEEFMRISENPEVSFENIGTPICELLNSNNRKIFFLHFNPTMEKMKLEAVEPMYDGNGEIIDERIIKRYVYEETILSMFLSKLLAPENAQIMRHVDAIHILVPKADLLGERPQREEKAKMMIEQRYQSLREGIRHCCKHYEIRNEPEIIPFSIGKFYIGNVFEPDPTDTLSLIDVIKDDIDRTQNVSVWQRLFHRFRSKKE